MAFRRFDHAQLICARQDDLRTLAVGCDFAAHFHGLAFEFGHVREEIGIGGENDGGKWLRRVSFVQVQSDKFRGNVHLGNFTRHYGLGADMFFGLIGWDPDYGIGFGILTENRRASEAQECDKESKRFHLRVDTVACTVWQGAKAGAEAGAVSKLLRGFEMVPEEGFEPPTKGL